MMNYEKRITRIIKLHLKLQCYGVSYHSLCNHTNAYILVKGTITVGNTAAQSQPNNGVNKKVIFTNCALFTSCITRINNTLVDDAQYINVVK